MIRALLCVLLLAALARAGDTPDTSLAQEVENYLDEVQGGSEDPTTFRAFWKEGLRLETSDGSFRLKIFGMFQWDSHWRSSSDFSGDVTDDGTLFRRVRAGFEGVAYRNMEFKIQLDFAKGTTALRDAYLGLLNLPVVGTFRAGQFFEPFGLEAQTSAKYTTFIERATPSDTFAPSRNTGFMLANAHAEGRVTWAIGIFRDTDDQGAVAEDGGYAMTVRITTLPLRDDEAGRLVHLGVAFSLRDPNGETLRFQARPGTGSGPRLVDTSDFAADELVLVGFEFAVVWRAFSVQAEAFLADATGGAGAPDPSFSGFYVEVSWFVTGERRAYKGSVISRTKPHRNFHNAAGPGAWQVAFRFDSLDLTDGSIVGGEQETLTFGVNWHWNPNARVMFNVVLADVDGPSAGEITIFQTRFAVDF